MLGRIGIGELVLIFGIVLLLVGAKRLPELARSIGRGIHEFQSGLKDVHNLPAQKTEQLAEPKKVNEDKIV